MNKEELSGNIKRKGSFLCVGLDSDLKKIPALLSKEEDPVFSFNKEIVDATADYCVAYKPNFAFYESRGCEGLKSLEKTVDYIRTRYPDQFLIADAKRGDIGNTSELYAREVFEYFDFDAVTVAPYMGEDSVSPFFAYKDKWVILLVLTSNRGSSDFQFSRDESGEYLFQKVLKHSKNWGNDRNMMYVVGATQTEMLSDIRKIVPDHFLLVPGIGIQGGSLKEVAEKGINKDCGLLVNSSRKIIFADPTAGFSVEAGKEAGRIQAEMAGYLKEMIN